jgi:hypothetical protein
MTTKLKNRIKRMTFQKTLDREIKVEDTKETKYYEEMYKQRTMELLGIKNEDIYGITGRRL